MRKKAPGARQLLQSAVADLLNVEGVKIHVSDPEDIVGEWPRKCSVHVDDVELLAFANNKRNCSRLGNCLAVAWAIMKGAKGREAWDRDISNFAEILTELCADPRARKRTREIDSEPGAKSCGSSDMVPAETLESGFPPITNGETAEWGVCVECNEHTTVLALGKWFKGKTYCGGCWSKWMKERQNI